MTKYCCLCGQQDHEAKDCPWPKTGTVTNLSDQARADMVKSLRHVANQLEAGATVIKGGLFVLNLDQGIKLGGEIVISHEVPL